MSASMASDECKRLHVGIAELRPDLGLPELARDLGNDNAERIRRLLSALPRRSAIRISMSTLYTFGARHRVLVPSKACRIDES